MPEVGLIRITRVLEVQISISVTILHCKSATPHNRHVLFSDVTQLIVLAGLDALTNDKIELQIRGTAHSFISPVGKAKVYSLHLRYNAQPLITS